jgi:beta-glucosidase
MILVHLSQLHTYSMQGVQKGKIGITLVSHWCTPFSNSKSDVAAAIRQVDFMLGWYILSDPCKFYRNNFNKIHILLEYC